MTYNSPTSAELTASNAFLIIPIVNEQRFMRAADELIALCGMQNVGFTHDDIKSRDELLAVVRNEIARHAATNVFSD